MIASAAGRDGRPGIVMISPQITTTNPAPADRRTSRIGTECPVGAPRRLGSVENEYWVLAMQIGRSPVARLFPLAQLVADLLVGQHLVRAVDSRRDGLDLASKRHVVSS